MFWLLIEMLLLSIHNIWRPDQNENFLVQAQMFINP